MVQRVHIKLQRVQTWLFEAPRLRAMVGANALLGEMLRVELPKLARETERGWQLSPSAETYPSANPNDPLKEHDDPASDARDGILARDGGHFEALFAQGAQDFADAAAECLRAQLPGLRFYISIDGEPCGSQEAHLSTALPVLTPCEWTGNGVASISIQQGTEYPAVSLGVKQRHESAQRAERGEAHDIASLLSAKTRLKNLTRAEHLEEFTGKGYLALIHADGNSVGAALGPKASDRERAAFHHKNRVLLRCALKAAIDTHCPETGDAPLQPLMLGGDDLLLLARADIALPFVVTLCAELAALQQGMNGFKLTLGIGVVIAKYSIPIHRLHELAEQLAASAKRRYRGFKKDADKRSVLDWTVFSTAWVDDIEQVRRRDWLCGTKDEPRALSRRPLDVLGKDRLDSLQGLLSAANKIARAPRSQLRYLIEQLPRGQALAELAFTELTAEAKNALEAAGLTSAWQYVDETRVTSLLDLVEISEIAHLGPTQSAVDRAQEAEHV